MPNRTEIDRVVRAALADITDRKLDAIHDDDRVVEDLRAGSDELSFVFVPWVETQLGVRVPVERWRSVHSVADIVSMLEAVVREKNELL